MKDLNIITDPVYIPGNRKKADKFLLRFIRDERDLPFIRLSVLISFTLLPAGIALYLPFITGWW